MTAGSAPAVPLGGPAALPSPVLAALFPPGVQAAELQEPAGPEMLTPDEWRSIRHCHVSRIRDFTAGRLCARQALLQLGVRQFSLMPGPARQPRWPPEIVGSITHTAGHAAAAVARTRHAAALGIDSVLVGELAERLWPGICTPRELSNLSGLAPHRRSCAAALIFAAKEAFFKCQFALTGEWLSFRDVHIQLEELDGPSGKLAVLPQRELRLAAHLDACSPQRLQGRYLRHGRFMTVGFAITSPGALALDSRRDHGDGSYQ